MKKKIEAGEQKLNPVVGGLEDTEETDALTKEDKEEDNDVSSAARLIHLDPSNKKLIQLTKAYYAMAQAYYASMRITDSPSAAEMGKKMGKNTPGLARPSIEQAAQFYDPSFDRRNQIQVNSIMKEIYSGEKKHLLVAVGNHHLPGPYGVLDLLRKQGFTIKKVKVFDQPHLTFK